MADAAQLPVARPVGASGLLRFLGQGHALPLIAVLLIIGVLWYLAAIGPTSPACARRSIARASPGPQRN
jgi:hypothetical protein